MNDKIYLCGAILFLWLLSSASASAQIASGGSYTIEKSVIAGGGASGATASAGGNYKIEGTIGQAAAGTKQQNVGITFQPGFWNAASALAPTAAEVTIGGRILTADGRGIRNVSVTLTSGSGEIRTAVSGESGSYSFAEVTAGATYIFSVRAKHYQFSQPTQIRSINDDTDDVDFIASTIKLFIK